MNGDRVDDALDYDINGVDFACGGGVFDHRGDRVEEGGSRRCISCNGMGPANEFLFLEEGQGEQLAVITYGPDDFEGLFGPSPAGEGEAVEEMRGDSGDVGTGVDIGVDVVGGIADDRAFGLDVKHVEVGDDWWDVGDAVEGLGIGDEGDRGNRRSRAATVDQPGGSIGEHQQAGGLRDHGFDGVELAGDQGPGDGVVSLGHNGDVVVEGRPRLGHVEGRWGGDRRR